MINVLKGARPRLRTFSLTLTLMLVLGLATAAVATAEPAPIPVDPNTYAELVKVIERPMGVHMPDTGFNFSATPHAFNGGSAAAANFPPITSVALTTEDGILPDAWVDTYPEVEWGIKSVERAVRFDLATLVFSQAGQYDYLVEQQVSNHDDMTDSINQVLLRITVGGDNAISNVAFFEYAAGTVGAELAPPRFVSTYTPYGSMTVTVEVSGENADPNKDFDFKIRLTSTSFAPFDGTVDARISSDGGAGGTPTTITYNRWYNFSLRDGQVLHIDELPLGTAFMVDEYAATGYIPSVAVVINGGNPFTYSAGAADRALSSEAALGQSFLVENRVIGAGTNSVTFNNYMPGVAAPHIIMDNLLWIALAGFAFVGFVGFVMIIRRRG